MIDETALHFLHTFDDTLKNTSVDHHNADLPPVYMTKSEMQIINFDRVKDAYVKSLQLFEVPLSCDALLVREQERWCFIEFKNGAIDPRKNAEIKMKLYDSLLLLLDIIKKTIAYTRDHLEYILVYNEQAVHSSAQFCKEKMQTSESLTQIENAIAGLAKEPFVQFGLRRYERLYFKTVRTYTADQFERLFVAKQNKTTAGAL